MLLIPKATGSLLLELYGILLTDGQERTPLKQVKQEVNRFSFVINVYGYPRHAFVLDTYIICSIGYFDELNFSPVFKVV